ncbi:hypothetical protein K4A87_10510 [Xanthomonas fragariae]|nr:hypothetical protein K4A87_10510 [Xanthomonas fragariae]
MAAMFDPLAAETHHSMHLKHSHFLANAAVDDHFDANGAALRVQLPADQLAGLKTRLCDATGNCVYLSTPEAA